MRAVVALFAVLAATPVLLWFVAALLALRSSAEFLSILGWLLPALLTSTLIVGCGFVVALLVDRMGARPE